MASQASIKVEILADPAKFEQGMFRTAQATENISQKLSNFAKLAVAALAVKALGAVKDFVGDSVRAFSDLNESLNALDVTYGENADEIKRMGQAAAQSLGLSNAEFNTFAVSISAFAEQIAKGLGGDVPQVVDDLTRRITDFASVMNLQVVEAQTKFASGLAGESEPLRRFGIDVSATTVKAYALANGIISVGEEMTEAQKVQARYGTIMEQTEKVQGDFANTATDYANAQRIANAETENAKARIGELLVPVAQLGTELKLNVAQGLGLFATAIAEVTGKLTHTQAVMQQYQQLSGATADTLEFAVGVNQRYGVSFEELFEQMTFAEGGLKRLSTENEAYLRQIGYTQEEIDDLNRLIGDELVRASNDARDAGRHHKDTLEEQTGASEELEGATEDVTSALREQFDLIDGRLDTFADLTRATDDQAEAQKAVTAAIEEFGEGSPEHLAALEDLAGANRDLRDAQITVVDQGGLTRDEFIKQQIELGLTYEQAKLLADKYNELFTPRDVTHTIRVKDLSTGQYSSDISGKAHGGPVQKGQPYKVGEQGEEVFIPDSYGTIVPNNKISRGGSPLQSGDGSMMPPVVVNFNISPQPFSDPHANAKAIIEYLDRYRRSNGRFPWER